MAEHVLGEREVRQRLLEQRGAHLLEQLVVDRLIDMAELIHVAMTEGISTRRGMGAASLYAHPVSTDPCMQVFK